MLNYEIHQISLFNEQDDQITNFLDNLGRSPSKELSVWLDVFKRKDILTLIGENYSYGINFRYDNELGCPFYIKEINSTDVINCIVGGCNPKIGLIIFNIFSRALSCIHTIENVENKIYPSKDAMHYMGGLIIRDLQSSLSSKDTKDKLSELEDLKKELEQQASRILSLSISPNKDKLYEFYNAIYPMIPEFLIEQFISIQK